jgi:hypothetical protein
MACKYSNGQRDVVALRRIVYQWGGIDYRCYMYADTELEWVPPCLITLDEFDSEERAVDWAT